MVDRDSVADLSWVSQWWKAGLHSFLLCLFIVLGGCGEEELYSQLKEREANEMIAILLDRGIEASKTAGKENTYSVTVEKDGFSRAVSILGEYGYPRTNFVGVGQVFEKTGLVSSPSEERIRYMHALAQDLAETITLIAGVISTRVHIVLPDNNPFAQESYPSSAAIFIDYRPDSGIENSVPKIKNMVMNSIEGLSYENISLAMFPAEIIDTAMPPGSVREDVTQALSLDVEEESAERLYLIMGLLFIVALALGGAVAFLFQIYRKKKSEHPEGGT